MIKVMERMPIGTVGFEATGKVTKDDYESVLVPAVRAAMEQRAFGCCMSWARTSSPTHPVRCGRTRDCGQVTGMPGSESRSSPTLTGVENGVKAFSWLMPGKIRVDDDDVDQAKLWLVTPDSD